MADDKRGRDKQADDTDRRQRRRDLAEELERGDETEPPLDSSEIGFEAELDSVVFPATGVELLEAVGDREVEAKDTSYAVAELLPETDEVVYESPAAVRARIQRPTIAVAMKRILEASDRLPNAELGRSQREAYEKTFRELKAIDAVDDDEGIPVVRDWILEQIEDKGKLPGSRAVRRRAGKFCRANGYTVRNDEWLGV